MINYTIYFTEYIYYVPKKIGTKSNQEEPTPGLRIKPNPLLRRVKQN